MRDLADIAASQWGLVTTAQARITGATPQDMARYANQGRLERVSHGVYRIAGTPQSPLDDLRAAWLTLDPARTADQRLFDRPPAVVSHRSAARIHNLGNLDSDISEFTTLARKQTRRPDVRIHQARIGPGEWTIIDGLPLTTITRTITDLASQHIDGGHLAGVVRDALIKHQTDPAALASALAQYARYYGAPCRDGEKLLAQFLRETGMPAPLAATIRLATANEAPPRTTHRSEATA